MFRKKPATSPPPDAAPSPDWAHGFHYLAPQSALIFGSDRREPVTWRPGVSLARRGAFTLVLPATRRPHAHFFHIQPDDLLLKTPAREPLTDSYLCYQYEAVRHDQLLERGILRHGLRLDIAAWLKQRLGGSRG
ncbi:MAG: hypothetical protein IT490_09110 [Candidatus Contendobacter sp.]|nr:hypothetical protein [Candidatus Contendobacter sp.]